MFLKHELVASAKFADIDDVEQIQYWKYEYEYWKK